MLRLGENEFGKEEKMGKKEMMRTLGRGESKIAIMCVNYLKD